MFFSTVISSCRCEQVLQEHRRNDWLQTLHLVEDLLGLLHSSCLPGKTWGILSAGVDPEGPLSLDGLKGTTTFSTQYRSDARWP